MRPHPIRETRLGSRVVLLRPGGPGPARVHVQRLGLRMWMGDVLLREGETYTLCGDTFVLEWPRLDGAVMLVAASIDDMARLVQRVRPHRGGSASE